MEHTVQYSCTSVYFPTTSGCFWLERSSLVFRKKHTRHKEAGYDLNLGTGRVLFLTIDGKKKEVSIKTC